MAIRTLSQIITDAINFIRSKRPNAATFTGTVIRDVVVESPAQEFNNVYTELTHTQQLQSVVYATNMTMDELDALGGNYEMLRNVGRQATGTVAFQIRNYSSASFDITVPIGTVIATQGSNNVPQISFVTTQSITFLASLAPSYFNPTTGLYEQNATIIAESIGTTSNVAAGTITQLVSSVTVDSVTNYISTTGGTDIESNETFGTRIQTKLNGNSIGTPLGIMNLMKSNANVIDAITVTPNDVEMIRNEFGGSVDVYILGELLTPIADIDLYQTTGSQDFILQHQPTHAISSIVGIASGVTYSFKPGVDYSFVLDPTTLLNGSTQVQNLVRFNIGGTNPDDATNITISYVYDSLIELLQNQLDADDGHIITSDILVKEAQEAVVDVTADVILFPGNIPANVILDVQTALSNYINVLGLGDSIDKSDIVSVIEGVTSVDQVNLNTLVLSKNGVPLTSTEQRLYIFKMEYPRTGTLQINIV